MWHGTADNFVNYPNLAEEVKEWSGVMDVSWAKNVMDSSQMGYTQMVFGDGSRFTAYSAAGVGHMVPAHGSVDLKWFGIT